MSDAPGTAAIMLRNLLLAGLTTLLLVSVATASPANRNGAAKKADHHGAKAPPPDTSVEAQSIAPVVKPVAARSAKIRQPGKAKPPVARRAQAAVVSQSLLRPSWTVADLNPMPQLLDLDDTARDLRRATAEILRMMTR